MTEQLNASQRTFIKSVLISLSAIRRRKKVHQAGSTKWNILHELENEILTELYAQDFGPDAINEVGTMLEELNLIPSDFWE